MENLKLKGTPKLSPDTVITIGNGARSDEATPSLNYINANPMLKEVQDLIDWAIASIQKIKGLSPEQYDTEVAKVSGIAKSIDNSEIEEIRKNKTNICRMFETDLFEVMRTIYNYHNSGNKISDTAEFSIQFAEPKIIESQTDKNARRDFGLKNNITSRIRLIMEDNPGMTEEEAQKEFKSIVAQNRMLKDEYGLEDEINAANLINNNPETTDRNVDKLDIEEEL